MIDRVIGYDDDTEEYFVHQNGKVLYRSNYTRCLIALGAMNLYPGKTVEEVLAMTDEEFNELTKSTRLTSNKEEHLIYQEPDNDKDDEQ